MVHNAIIPLAPLSTEDVLDRVGRYRLEVAYLGDTLVGCATIRPPDAETDAVTVIVRVLPEHRGRGIGDLLYQHALRSADAGVVETIVWASNVDGLRFAEKRGYVEVDRYVLDGEEVPYVTLRRQTQS